MSSAILAEGAVITSSDFMSVITALQEQISVSTIVGVLAAGAGLAVGFVFMWWGVRKLIGVIMNAVRKGRVNV